jgi:2-oxoglutarate dehydrogenase E1 component
MESFNFSFFFFFSFSLTLLGFTTDPSDSRPGVYCTDVVKAVGAPIFHVNGDDVDAVCWVFKVATEYRQRFNAVCYTFFFSFSSFNNSRI